ncbi:MAG: preprotein translocase subunit SecY [bacterium]|nr:preprotein translocase subunit SecY [bacterium]
MNKILNLFKIPDIRKKLFVVLGLLVVFRLLASIPIPGVDAEALRTFFGQSQLLSFLNIFSGGGLSNLSIAMLGVGPYITGTIIMQLLTMIFPNLKKLYYEEGEQGRAKFNRISRYLTVPLAALQGFGFLNLLMGQKILPGLSTYSFEMFYNIAIITAGTMILVWLGELITEQKIGNGVSLIIFAGIIASFPQFVGQELSKYLGTGATGSELPTHLAFIVVGLLVTAGVVFIQQGERKIPVSYARRVRGNKIYGGVASYLPLKVNQAGVIPIIFAISLLLFPQFFAQIIAALISPDLGIKVTDIVSRFMANQLLYGSAYFILVVAFTYFYTAVTFDPQEISMNLQKSGGFIPGIRPGESTGLFLSKIINRITLFGALFLGAIAILPNIVQAITGSSQLSIGGTSLLIVVSVALETMNQIDSQLTIREYEGLN